jgi:hypothetical protein
LLVQFIPVSSGWAIAILVGALLVCILGWTVLLWGRERDAMERAGDSQLPAAVRTRAIAWLSQRAARGRGGSFRGRVSSLLSHLEIYERNGVVRDAAARGLRVIETADETLDPRPSDMKN